MVAVVVFVTVLCVLAILQVGLALGAPWGAFAWGGQHRVLPTRLRLSSAVTPLVYVVFAVVILDRAGMVDVLPKVVADVGTWIVFGFAALSSVVNAISRSKPERYTAAPAAAILAVTSLMVALG